MKRWREIDALRGFMLVMMTVTHVPTRFSGVIGQPLGFVSAAEGFVFLSAFMASFIFARRAAQKGVRAMLRAFLARAAKLYACHVVMLAFLFTVIASIGIRTDRQAIKNLISFYLQEPVMAIGSSLLLVYNPPLLDILPMYVVFMLVSPWLMAIALRWSWTPILIASLILWAGSQFGLARELYESMRDITGLTVPYHETGAFDMLAWQMIWFMGLWLGARTAGGAKIQFAPSIVYAAFVIATAGLVIRYWMGQAPLGEHEIAALLLGKWRLGALRLINFLALAVVIIHCAPSLKSLIRWRPLERLGAASLPVFCAHLIAVLLILAVAGDRQGTRSAGTELALLAGTLVLMLAIAVAVPARPSSAIAAPADRDIAVSARAGR